MKIAVIGLGYVGLPLALLAEEKGFDVIGIDLDKNKLTRLSKRQPIIDDTIANKQLEKTNIRFSDDFSLLQNVDIAIVCVPTPVDEAKNPDLGPVKGASVSVAKQLKPGSLLVIESTINPGVCDEVVIPIIEKETDHVIGKSLYIAHCPERINPGDPKWHVGNINRVLGADSDKALDMAYKFYDQLVDAKVKKMGSIKEAEACKVVENSFRDINIAFVNELAMSFDKLGINVVNVIDGAATKPFAFMAHYPGIGVGGHCIPVDPYYLIEYARSNGFEHKFLSLARSINESMPVYAIDQLEQALIQKSGRTLDGASVTVLGLSYKPNVADDRESPAYVVIRALKKRGARVTGYDPYLLEKSDAKSLPEALQDKDAVILVTSHQEFKDLAPEAFAGVSVLLDGRNDLIKHKAALNELGVVYLGLGLN
ncbi:MAG TPA: nucleotide sugar dehydrogenase [Candidatus Limnocylindria bacterium]|nr:nucleotide sugar dehydrogenase [Candidatus Limnocylindria bacterium]